MRAAGATLGAKRATRRARLAGAGLWVTLGALAGCGARTAADDAAALAACRARHAPGPRMTVVPACIRTTQGVMAVETEYLPGVVDCELGWFTRAAPALEAQAIAARTYLMSHLARKNDEDALIHIGPRFQCWRPAHHDRSRAAALATRDQVLHHKGTFLLGNYVAGARHRGPDCAPESPRKHGYPYDDWEAMRAAYHAARKKGVRRAFKGVYWTEVLVTDNAGKVGAAVAGTPFASPGPINRGALGQYAAACLAERDAPPAVSWGTFEGAEDAVDAAEAGTCAQRSRRKRTRAETRDSARAKVPGHGDQPIRRGGAAMDLDPTPIEGRLPRPGDPRDGDPHGGHPPGSTAAILAHFYGADVEVSVPWRPEDATRLLDPTAPDPAHRAPEAPEDPR